MSIESVSPAMTVLSDIMLLGVNLNAVIRRANVHAEYSIR